ncbi:MAG: hypothetical protein PHX08_00400 [Lachnospiraceae bacterium]|nr:hypothetical protein [Lachnospiraceae bacterium]
MSKGDIWIWISHKLKCISFHPLNGFEKTCMDTYTEMWELVYLLVEQGYRVQ